MLWLPWHVLLVLFDLLARNVTSKVLLNQLLFSGLCITCRIHVAIMPLQQLQLVVLCYMQLYFCPRQTL